jgi:hypothetical protein
MSEKDGGPAFPIPGLSNLPNGEFIHPNGGMSLRDYIAISASEEDILAHGGETDFGPGWEARGRSREAAKYAYADAMLAERNKASAS